MSTGFECMFVEVEPARWFYVLQDWNCPVGAWDWREYATAYGPFSTEKMAQQHLFAHHANPGGWWSQTYTDGYSPDDVMKKLIKEAKR